MLAVLLLLLSIAPATLASWAVAPPAPRRGPVTPPARLFKRDGNDGPIWIMGSQNPIAVTRLDPIVDPGKVGGHVHSIFGASNFRSTLLEPGEQQKSACTNVKVHADKSNYWFPLMYFHNANGTFSAVDHSSHIYYFGTNNGAKMHAFPPGLRMIAGLAKTRSPWDIRTQGHSLDAYFDSSSNVPGIIMKFLPNSTTHRDPPKVIDLALTFPSCGWANQSLDSYDHFSHMTWPIRVNNDGTTDIDPRGDTCPDTHPIKYPIIHSEMLYNIDQSMQDQWGKTGRSEFVLSNGDTTGLTYHGDFVSGWDVDIMTQALATCRVADEIQNCPAFANYDQWEKDKCLLEGEIVDEDVGYFRPIDNIPGCNPYWGWDGPDDKPGGCSGPNPGFVAPNLQLGPARIPYVVPGFDTTKYNLDDPKGVVASSGAIPSKNQYLTLKPRSTNITYFGVTTQIEHGTQDDVNARANSPNTQSLPLNANAALFAFSGTQGTPTAVGDPKGVVGTSYPYPIKCNEIKYWNGATCSTAPQAKGPQNPPVNPALLKADPNAPAPTPAATPTPTASPVADAKVNFAKIDAQGTTSTAAESGSAVASGVAAAASGTNSTSAPVFSGSAWSNSTSAPVYSGTAWSNSTSLSASSTASGSASTTASASAISVTKPAANPTASPGSGFLLGGHNASGESTEPSGSALPASVSISAVPTASNGTVPVVAPTTASGSATATANAATKPSAKPGRCRPKARPNRRSRL